MRGGQEEGRAPSPARTGATVYSHRAEFCPPAPGAPSGVNPLPAFPRFTRAASRASETGGTPPPTPAAARRAHPRGAVFRGRSQHPAAAASSGRCRPAPARLPRGSAARSRPASPAPRPPHAPAQERLFQILSSRMMMAARWDRSPVRRKMFMAAAAEAAAQPEPGSEDGASSAGTERRGPGTWPGSPAPVHAGKRGERPPRPAPPSRRGLRGSRGPGERRERLWDSALGAAEQLICIYIYIK